MNSKISPKDFFSAFNKGNAEPSNPTSLFTKNTLKAMTLVAAIALTGCSTPGSAYNEIELNQSEMKASGHQVVQLKEFNADNFKEIISESKSGVYKDPYETKNIVSFQFSDDPNAEASIKKDLSDQGLDVSSYDWQVKLYKTALDLSGQGSIFTDYGENEDVGNLSRHVQDPVGVGDDINLSMLDFAEHGDNHNKLLFMQKYIDSRPDLLVYDNYFVAMHEVAHGFEYQQMGMLDFATLAAGKTEMIQMMEMGADVAAAIKTIQTMHHNGLPDEDINIVLNALSDTRSYVMHGGTHTSTPAVQAVIAAYEQNPDAIYNMTGEQIIQTSELIAKHVADYDFKDDVVNYIATHGDFRNDILKTLHYIQNLMNSDIDSSEQYVQSLINIDNPQISSLGEKVMDNFDILRTLNDDQLVDMAKEAYGDSLSSGALDYTDIDTAAKISLIGVRDFPGFAHEAVQVIEEAGLYQSNSDHHDNFEQSNQIEFEKLDY